MPKAWSKKEKKLIKKALQTQGRKLFEKYGVQKTTVAEIVRAAHISKGTFYLFYKSKEELYFDIIETVELEFREKLFSSVFQQQELTKRESFKKFLYQIIDLMTKMPIYNQLNSANYEYLKRKLPEETLKRRLEKDKSDTFNYFSQWIKKGWIKKIDIEALNGILLSFFYFIIHRDDFGELNFNASRDMWIDMLSNYLIPDQEAKT